MEPPSRPFRCAQFMGIKNIIPFYSCIVAPCKDLRKCPNVVRTQTSGLFHRDLHVDKIAEELYFENKIWKNGGEI